MPTKYRSSHKKHLISWEYKASSNVPLIKTVHIRLSEIDYHTIIKLAQKLNTKKGILCRELLLKALTELEKEV